jgi:hypothetical protein
MGIYTNASIKNVIKYILESKAYKLWLGKPLFIKVQMHIVKY